MPTSLLPSIRPAQEARKIRAFIKSTLKNAKRTKVIVASSGGVDSSTTLALAASALKPTEVIVLKLPHNKAFSFANKNVDLLAKHLKIPKRNVFEVNIGQSVERIWKTILINLSTSQTGLTKIANQIRLGNIMARVRMIYAYDMAKARFALICGTENYSEHLLGYYTRFGDEASDLEPLKHLYKTQIYQLADYLKLPDYITQAKPTAGLWLEQTDREELGFSYKMADQVLYLRFHKKITPTQIAAKLHKHTQKKSVTYWKRQVKKVLDRANSSSFKQEIPYQL